MSDLDARAASLAAELALDPNHDEATDALAAKLKGLIGTDRRDYLHATIVQAETLQIKLFNRHERRDREGKWTDGGPNAPDAPGGGDKITASSHAHESRPSFTPEKVAKMAPDEADRYVRNAREHLDNLIFQREHDKKKVSTAQVESARQWVSSIEEAAAQARTRARATKDFNPHERRDERGRWTDSGSHVPAVGGGGSRRTSTLPTAAQHPHEASANAPTVKERIALSALSFNELHRAHEHVRARLATATGSEHTRLQAWDQAYSAEMRKRGTPKVSEARSGGPASGTVHRVLRQVERGTQLSHARNQDLVNRGYAKWDGPGKISLTDKGREKLREPS